MKKIKIFLASSIEDLREDRVEVGDFFCQLNEIYLDSGIHFSLIKCESYDNAISIGGKQQEYDREIRESELVFFLFFRKVGDYTRHEFEVALDSFQNCQKPKIITYFKTVADAAEVAQEVQNFMRLLDGEIKHYYNTYGHIDTLKLGILMQIKLLKLDDAQIKLENGVVSLNGQPIAKAENVPMLHGNQTLRELTEQKRQLQQTLSHCRAAYLADPTPENEAAFFDASAQLNRVSKQLTQIEEETMQLLTTVAEMTSDGRILTYRQKEALKYFNQGDYAAVRTVLEDEERENELSRAEARAEVAKKEIQGYVEEELLLIKTQKAQGLTEESVQRILTSYQKIAKLVEQHDLKKSVLYAYADFLCKQNRFAEAITVAEKLRWYYADPSIEVKEYDKAKLYNLRGILFSKTQQYEEAEKAYKQALEICRRLAARNPEAYEPALARCYNNLGVLYKDTQRYKDAEKAYEQALEIRRRLVAQNPEAYEPGLSDSYNNLGNLYSDTQRYEEAEKAYKQALEIRRRLAGCNPEAYEPDLSDSYNNLGVLYKDIQRYEEAEKAYEQALEIRRRLVARNPEAYEPDLAASYNNLGILYSDTQQYEEAEKAYEQALKIRRRLAARNPEAYEPDLALSYNNLGSLYDDTQRYEEAEKAYEQALEIRRRLAAQNPEAYELDLADSYNNLGLLYSNTQRYEEAEAADKQALEIRRRLAARNPEAYEPDLTMSYNNLGVLYFDTRRYEEAEKAYEQVLEIRRRLAARNPQVYEPALADCLWNFAGLYESQGKTEALQEILRVAFPLYEKLAKLYPNRYQEKLKIIWENLNSDSN